MTRQREVNSSTSRRPVNQPMSDPNSCGHKCLDWPGDPKFLECSGTGGADAAYGHAEAITNLLVRDVRFCVQHEEQFSDVGSEFVQPVPDGLPTFVTEQIFGVIHIINEMESTVRRRVRRLSTT